MTVALEIQQLNAFVVLVLAMAALVGWWLGGLE
jgi:hypothetical protein